MCHDSTLSYTAPEILRYKPYDERVDHWSLGVIMYILVCGYPPFGGDNDYDLCNEIVSQDVEFDEEDWTHVGEETRSLIESLLAKQPRHRANCLDIIETSWRIDVQHAAWTKAHRKFKQTVLLRKMNSHSSSHTATSRSRHNSQASCSSKESSSKRTSLVDPQPVRRRKRAQTVESRKPTASQAVETRMRWLTDAGINSLDDSVLKRRKRTGHGHDAHHAWKVGGAEGSQSKTAECLYLLSSASPMNPRDSIFTKDLGLDLLSYSNRSSPMTPLARKRLGASMEPRTLADITSAGSVEFDDDMLDGIGAKSHTVQLSGLGDSWSILELEKQKTVEIGGIAEYPEVPASIGIAGEDEKKMSVPEKDQQPFPSMWSASTTTTPIEDNGIDITMLNSLNVAVEDNGIDITMLNSISHNYSNNSNSDQGSSDKCKAHGQLQHDVV